MSEHINVTTFVACEKVIQEAENFKKSIIGVFTNFNFDQLPARFVQPWFLYAQLSNVDPGKADVTVNIVHDQTQGVIFAAGMELIEGHPDKVDLILPMQATEFHKEGKHVVTLNVDGNQCAYFVLNVTLKKQLAGG